MKVLDFSLNATKNGGKITAFNYSHGLNELCGSWSASIAGGNFKAGDNINFGNVMQNGIISRAKKNSEGLWQIAGYDAGIRLMRSTPDISDLPNGNAKTVISNLASFCGIPLSMTGNGLSGFNVRSIISGSTCAEAVLELAMFSGYIAFIDNEGQLCVQAPLDKRNPVFENVIDDSGSDFDLDGYATQVAVTLTRRSKDSEKEDDTSGDGTVYYTGQTPDTTPTRKTFSGSFTSGEGTYGSYSVTMLQPFDVTEREETTITQNGLTIHTIGQHSYDYKHKTIWRDNQEYVLFAFYEQSYTLTKQTTGSYSTSSGETLTFSETTTENMNRTVYEPFDAVGVPEDWQGHIGMVDTETITRSTVRTGGKEPSENMPAYSPPYDVQITRRYSREDRGKGLLCNETETRYEARQVGTISPVKVDGVNVPHFLLGSNLAIQTHSTPQWVQINSYRTYYEKYDNNGDCVLSTRSEYSDDGSKWLSEHALSDTGDDDLNEYQKAYAKFSQGSHGLEVSLHSSVISSAWHFIELQGRMKNSTANDEDGTTLGNFEEYYNNGAYINLGVCPHYNSSTQSCNIFALADVVNGTDCHRNKGLYFWQGCNRAMAALTLIRDQEASQLEAPIIGTASLSNVAAKSPTIGYNRDIYVDDAIETGAAQSIANTIASNILAVKGTKGIRRTVTIPYTPTILPDGAIVEVAHDWEALTTSVTYRAEGDIPDFLVAQSVSGIAAFVSAREASKLSVPKYGVVLSVADSKVSVKIGNNTVNCTTKLKNLGVNDNVLVSFPSGNKLRGQVIARL